MADNAIVAADVPRNDTTHLNTGPEIKRDFCPDAAILAAFKRFQEGYAILNAMDPAERRAPGEDHTPTEKLAWSIIDPADTEVQSLPATTPAGIACKLWVAIVHSDSNAEEEAAAIRADLDWFIEQGDMIDWNIRLIISALRDLKSMVTRTDAPTDDPVSRYWPAFHACNADQLAEDEYVRAFNEMHEWTPPTPLDFVRKFEAAYSIGGHPNEENEGRLIAQAVSLIGARAGKEA